MTRTVFALVAVAVMSCAHGAAAPSRPATPDEVVAAARGAIEQWRQAYEVRSVDALAKLYVHGPALVVVHDGTPELGWTSVHAMLQAQLARAKEVHVRLEDVKVTSLAPSVATAVATMTREIGDGVTTATEKGALTLVLEKAGDDWKIVAEHYSYKRPG
jgi:ketosteroid isomerase-like protein